MRKSTLTLTTLCLGATLLLAPLLARAVPISPILDFGVTPPTSGSVTYAGGTPPLVGTNIGVRNVVGLGTPSNNGTPWDLVNGFLDFSSGPFTGYSGSNLNFAGGGSITLIGGIDSNRNGITDAGDIPDGSLLLSGTLMDARLLRLSSGFSLSVASFVDTINPSLLALYGIPDSAFTGSLNLQMLGSFDSSGSFASAVMLSGDATNTPMKEPDMLLLLILGTIAIVCIHLDRSA